MEKRPEPPQDISVETAEQMGAEGAKYSMQQIAHDAETLSAYTTPAGITAANAVEFRAPTAPMSLTASHTFLRSDVAVLRSDVQQNLARLAEFYDAKIGELDAKIAHIDRRLG